VAALSSVRWIAALALASGFCASAGAVELVVYTAIETDQLKAYAESHRRANPDIELRFVRDSTGAITSRLLSEKARPKADVILGVAASSMEVFKSEGMLVAYTPRGFGELERRFSDLHEPPHWVGMDIFSALICYNPKASPAARKAPKPTRWSDLGRPEYKGLIVMPSPVSSGTAYLQVVSWIQNLGEAKAWRFMDSLHANVARYTHSGSRPCLEVADGDAVIGISFDSRGNDLKVRGAEVELVSPRDGVGWDIEASAILKPDRKPEAARRFMDWVASREANEVYARHYVIVAHAKVKDGRLAFIPADLGKRLSATDFEYAARNRSRILAEWTRRYGAKTR
jgi:iron(III) transport system substrate-binding protein